MTQKGSERDYIRNLAQCALGAFDHIARAARSAIERGPTPLTVEVRNTFNNPTNPIPHDWAVPLELLAHQPVFARLIVRDETGKEFLYYVSSSSPPSFPRGCEVISRNAVLGRLASIPAGESVDIERPSGERTFTILERAILRPYQTEHWDSRDSRIEANHKTITVKSLRPFLIEQRDEVEEDPVRALIEAERLAELTFEGMRRNFIAKMGLRDEPILDKFQDDIFRLPINRQMLLLGPPGTGKTTTMIRRLAQKIDRINLYDDEVSRVDATGSSDHARDWLMFVPTELLRRYVKEAFAREGIPASDTHISTWTDYRHHLARSRLGLLRTASGAGAFVLHSDANFVADNAEQNLIQWYEDFANVQQVRFWSELSEAAVTLAKSGRSDLTKLAAKLTKILKARNPEAEGRTFLAISEFHDTISKLLDSLRKDSDDKIRKALNVAQRANPQFLPQLAKFIENLDAGDDIDEAPEDDDEMRDSPSGLAAAARAYQRTVRAHCRALARGRSLIKSGSFERILAWLDGRFPSEDDCAVIAATMPLQDALRAFDASLRRYANGIPARYRDYRRLCQREGRWYREGAIPARNISPLELDVIILAMLRTSARLLKERRVQSAIDSPRFAPLRPMMELYRNQILVDEVTDFSAIQLACMHELAHPHLNSFFACGDFNQRLSSWGVRREEDIRWCFPSIDIRTIVTSYRHSAQLNALAKALVELSGGDENRAVLPDRIDNDAVKPLFTGGLNSTLSKVTWLQARIAEIETLTDALPTIAVLVNGDDEVITIAKALSAALQPYNIRAVACVGGQDAGRENDVRVFDVQHIKGLEFEAVFFLDLGVLEIDRPTLFDKYLYVGATRAATYLGLTSAAATLPKRMAALHSHFVEDWSKASLRHD